MKFTYDGFGLNDADDPYRARVLTFSRLNQTREDMLQQDAAAALLVAAPALAQALDLIRAEILTLGRERGLTASARDQLQVMLAHCELALDKARPKPL